MGMVGAAIGIRIVSACTFLRTSVRWGRTHVWLKVFQASPSRPHGRPLVGVGGSADGGHPVPRCGDLAVAAFGVPCLPGDTGVPAVPVVSRSPAVAALVCGAPVRGRGGRTAFLSYRASAARGCRGRVGRALRAGGPEGWRPPLQREQPRGARCAKWGTCSTRSPGLLYGISGGHWGRCRPVRVTWCGSARKATCSGRLTTGAIRTSRPSGGWTGWTGLRASRGASASRPSRRPRLLLAGWRWRRRLHRTASSSAIRGHLCRCRSSSRSLRRRLGRRPHLQPLPGGP